MKKNIAILIFFGSILFSQGKINWQKTTDALIKAGEHKKTVMLYVKTEWCGFCRKLNKDVFSDKKVIKYINENFIPAKIDAESKFDIVKFNNKSYTAREYTRMVGVKSYPAIVFLSSEGKPIADLKGYYPKEDVLKVLEFINNNQKKNAE